MRLKIFLGSLVVLFLLTVLSLGMMSQGAMPVLAHPGTPEADDDGDGVANDLDSCSTVFGETWNNGCPYTPPAPQATATLAQVQVPTTAPAGAATPNPITSWNFTSTERDLIAQSPAGTVLGAVTTPRSLSAVGLQPNVVASELQDLSGGVGRTALQINYLFLNGYGNLFLTLGASSPTTDGLVGGAIQFTSYDPSVFELCALTTRVTRDDARNATAFIAVGLTNGGQVIVVDHSVETGAAATLAVSDTTLDLTQVHEIVAAVVGDQINVFADGALILADVPVVERSGVHGLAMVGAGVTRPRCEVRTFWTYAF